MEDRNSRSEASRYWDKNLDPQNLERGEGAGDVLALELEIEFAGSPDVEEAVRFLTSREGTAPSAIVDLGAGLGAVSFVFARRGSKVVSVDTSIARLRQLRGRAAEAGYGDKVMPIVADAEALPFADGSLRAVFTKSVLIHTNLKAAAGEIGRALAEGGRAALVEPMPGNPFARLYRNTLAPKAWKSITRYFDAESHETCRSAIGSGPVVPFYLFAFGAFVFQFAWPRLGLFRFALKCLGAVDRLLFRFVPWTRRLAWFGVVELEKPASGGRTEESTDG